MAEAAPEPVPLAPAGGADRAEKCAQRFPDLYLAATSERAQPSFKHVVQAWRLTKREDQDGALAGDWLMPRLREKFARKHRGVEKDYYCELAVAGGLLATDRSLHSILNTNRPALAEAEIACKVMAREAANGFAGARLKPQLEEATDRWVERLLSWPLRHVLATKRLATHVAPFQYTPVVRDAEYHVRSELDALNDTREAAQAFAERRPPVFNGD